MLYFVFKNESVLIFDFIFCRKFINFINTF